MDGSEVPSPVGCVDVRYEAVYGEMSIGAMAIRVWSYI
jgi:hypothetical protein